MQFTTPICEMLDIKYPILQGGMAWIAGGELAAAVSNAGGLGIIGSGSLSADLVQEEIHKLRDLSHNPFGVNIMLASAYVKEIVDLVIKEKVPVVTTGGGNPGPVISSLKEAGIKVIPVVSSVTLAKRLSRYGADAFVAEGTESGGHIGEMTTMVLVPMMADAVDVPVIAAGGIADGRGMMAAMALGAQGVQIGTRFVCSPECRVHQAYREKILAARDRATVVCGASTGHPVRAIHNRFTRSYQSAEKEGFSKESLDQLGRGRYPKAALEGDIEDGTILSGQSCGLVNRIQPAGEIVEEIILEAIQIKERMGGIQCSV